MSKSQYPDWVTLRDDLIAYCDANRGGKRELAEYVGFSTSIVSRWLREDGVEPRYSIGVAMIEWLRSVGG